MAYTHQKETATNLKAVADYDTGPDSEISLDRSEAAIQTAYEFLLCVTELIATEKKIHIPP